MGGQAGGAGRDIGRVGEPSELGDVLNADNTPKFPDRVGDVWYEREAINRWVKGDGSGDWRAEYYLPVWLRGIAKRKTLIFCVNGAHRSGNGAIMLLCASVANLSPQEAMGYLAQCRQISGPKQRLARNHSREHSEVNVDLATWLLKGGPWTFYAPFLTASAPRAPPLFIFCCFPSSPPGRFSSLPRLRLLVARPVAAQLPVPATASPCAGGLKVCRQAGGEAGVHTKATISFSPLQAQSLLKDAGRCC